MWARIALPLLIGCFLYFHFSSPNSMSITNPDRTDGFGAQFQTIIYAAIYAELKNLHFVYTPFTAMEHNYDNDYSFLDKKESLINLKNYYESAKHNAKIIKLSPNAYINYFEKHIKKSTRSKALKVIKARFRENKPANYYNNKKFNIAMHIRRPNAHDSRLAGADVPEETFIEIVEYLKDKYKTRNYLIHIYSQGNFEKFKSFADSNIVLHINESIEETFTGLVLADVLVMSPSSFSYTAGIISNGEVYYLPFWHAPLPGWNIINIDSGQIKISKA